MSGSNDSTRPIAGHAFDDGVDAALACGVRPGRIVGLADVVVVPGAHVGPLVEALQLAGAEHRDAQRGARVERDA